MADNANELGNPKIVIRVGKLTAEGYLVGLTVAKAKEMILDQLQDQAEFLAAAEARLMTMNDQDETWKAVPTPQEDGLFMRKSDQNVQMYQGVTKTVPDDYVIRAADVYLEFVAPAETKPQT